jgi:HK97 family phage portal protein
MTSSIKKTSTLMSKFTEKARTIIKNIGELALNKYNEAKIITSQIYADGFTYFNYSFRKLIKEGYASNTDVYSIISKIIRTGANIPYYIVKINPDGTEEEVTSGPLYDSVMNPNKRQNKFEFTEDALGYQLTTGNELLTGLVPAGFKMITQVNIIPPQLVTVKIIGKQLFDYTMKYIVKWRGEEIPFKEEDVKHIKYFNPTNEGLESGMGLSPLQAAYQTLSTSNELMYAGASAMKNRGANGLISAEGDRPMDEEESNNLQNTVNSKLGGAEKFNRVVATTARVKYTQFGLSPADLKMIENGVLTLRQLCSVYGADSSSFNDPANKKFNNLKEAQKSLYVNAVLPPLERHLAGYKELILPGWNEQDNTTYDIRLDLSGIEALQDDQAAEVQKQVNLSKGISDVIMRVGEGKIKPDSAVQILMWSFDMNETEARELVANTGEI